MGITVFSHGSFLVPVVFNEVSFAQSLTLWIVECAEPFRKITISSHSHQPEPSTYSYRQQADVFNFADHRTTLLTVHEVTVRVGTTSA